MQLDPGGIPFLDFLFKGGPEAGDVLRHGGSRMGPDSPALDTEASDVVLVLMYPVIEPRYVDVGSADTVVSGSSHSK